MRIILALLAAIVLSACGGTYYNPAVTQAQAQHDWKDCNYQAGLATANSASNDMLAAAMTQNRLIGQCLELRGYQRQ
jgi:hypothetical protein